ncbi:MAG: exosortase C-terminal domain/associated protein EpsI [Desulfomonilia bacterium]|jgi:EpsI family protein|uniref:Methanolan biosynthesis EpsI domain-containing protein n=1 Tax=anaerobic digester metagenome TaxID=1263854 RepID=A0A485LYS2_9ZZZZ|nr:EpsI family protein [Pseudomonadota bacterium]HON38350.1 EpsI family protein [Deltaproteobacteria bacterium]HRS56508.1 EpsI family protein [Desulfomonilia bacterium]HPD21667.1 EpsI family protein [Deltaproteobacteria bacterium]HPX18325.1 EpsI family protein [Deltaproteobacteria bacterium]
MDRTKKNAVYILVLALSVYGSSSCLKRALYSELTCMYTVPDTIGPWVGSDVDTDIEGLKEAIGAQRVVFRTYRHGRDEVSLYLAYYKDVNSANMVHAPEVCYTGQGWTMKENDIVPRTLGPQHAMVNRMVIEKVGRQELVYAWWQTGGKTIPRNSVNRFYQVMRSITGKHPSTVWVRISVALSDETAGDEERLMMFGARLMPLLGNYFTGS